ncbi:MAG TPA: hypothetical protein VFZ11_05010 [Gemmatimonadaceae bacterium]
MRRTPLFRLLSAVLAIWFALGLVESSALHVCPMHDGGAGAAVPAGAVHGAEHGAAHGAGHGAAHGVVADGAAAREDGAPGAPLPERAERHACSCLGECGLGVATAAPLVRIATVPTVVADGRPAVLRSRITVRSASSHLFPPATAPPAARVG